MTCVTKHIIQSTPNTLENWKTHLNNLWLLFEIRMKMGVALLERVGRSSWKGKDVDAKKCKRRVTREEKSKHDV